MPYRFLRDDQRALLGEAVHERDREIFIDCLAVLHDFAAGAGSSPALPAFEAWHVEAIFSRALGWNTAPLSALRQNIEINWKTADELRTCGAESDVCRHADEYADNVIRQYQMLRRAKAIARATSSPFFS